MADDVIDKVIEETTGGEVKPAKAAEPGPTYKVMGEAKIPVSKNFGKMVSGRKDQGIAAMKHRKERWDEALKYYNNDQMSHRTSRQGASGNTYFARKVSDNYSETENVVFSNTATIVPLVYAKNPKPEFTAAKEDFKKLASVLERLLYTLANMEQAPGFNLKPKMEQAVILATLTNAAWAETSFTIKQESSDAAMADLNRIAEAYVKAKDTQEIKKLEGELMALEEAVGVLSPSGPKVRNRPPHDVIVDPCSMDPSYDDANWIITVDYLPTTYLNARYGEKDKDGQVKSIYEPSHVLMGSDPKDNTESFTIFKDGEAGAYGHADKDNLKDAQRTKVYYYWDKSTRRVYGFADNKWQWPFWVWDDPYKLPRFFPLRKLSFHKAPIGNDTQGEVTYYLDQQDAINDINSEGARARLWASRNLFYDVNKVSPDDAEKIIKGPQGHAIGIKVPEGMKITDMVYAVPPPSLQFEKYFDKQGKYQAIDRIAGVDDIMRGAQFKTNTTNKAVDYYSSRQSTKVDAKIDAIETFIGGVFSDLAYMCLQNMDQATVIRLIGEDNEQGAWQQMTAQEISQNFIFQCVGGSTQKPTSASKKEEAVQTGQVLGQFAQAAPGTVLMIVLKLFQQAFDEITITDKDWEMLMKEIEAKAQAEQGGPPQQPEVPEPNRMDTKLNIDPGKILQTVGPMLAGLDPRMVQAMAQSLLKGVPIDQVVQQLMQVVTGGTNANQAQ